MPNFPRYNSTGQLTTQKPQPDAPASTEGQVQAQLAKTFTSAQESVVKMNKAYQSMKDTTAEYNLKSSIMDLEQKAELDPDYNASEKYTSEIDKAYASSGAGSTEANLLLKLQAQQSKIRIQGIFKKKQIANDQVTTDKLADLLLQNPTEENMDKVTALYRSKAGTTFWVEEAEKRIQTARKTAVETDIYRDNSTQEAQSSVLAELRKGSEGKYKDLTADQRNDMMKTAQARIFNNNQTYKRDITDSQNLRANGLKDKFAEGTASILDIEKEMAIPEESGGIKRSQLLQYQKAIVTGITQDLNRMLTEKTPDKDPTKRAEAVKKYLSLIDNFVDDNTDKLKAKEMLASAYTDGIIDSKEQKFLKDLNANIKDIEFNRSTSPIATSIKALKSFLKMQTNASDDEIALKIKGLVGSIGNGVKPDAAMKSMLSAEIVAKIPDLTTYPKTGRLKRDGNGNMIRVFPDGSYEPASEKK